MSGWSETSAPRRRRHGHVVVQAFIFTPLAVVLLAGLAFAVLNVAAGNLGYIVMLVVSGLLGLAVGYQAWGYLRDIGAEPTLAEGDVTKKWTKGNFFIFFLPSYYVAVKGKIYSIRRADYIGVLEGDLVRISHYPHSLTVESLHLYDSALKKFVPAVGGEQV